MAGNDNPWHFGTSGQYPVLDFGGHVVAEQRATVTLTASPTTIYERSVTTPARANSTTITATPSDAWHEAITITIPTNAAYTVSSISIPANSTTAATTTLTAVNNYTDANNFTVALNTASSGAWVYVASTVTITIADDDELAKPTGLKLSVDGTKIQADWTAVSGADGYTVQWNGTSSTSWDSHSSATVTTNTHKITTGLTAGTRYYVRVIATKTDATVDDSAPSDVVDATPTASAGTGDYDVDNDGLIEIANLAQLNAVRWDLDGDGVVDSASNATTYSSAFPNAEDNMGCNESTVSIASNNTGNLACSGYELSANLDFDTDGDDTADSGDTYWNSGQGWQPIGGSFNTTFEGNTYTLSNLHINRSGASTVQYAGLFGQLGSSAVVRNLKLADVSVSAATNTAATTNPEELYVGGIAGDNAGDIISSYVTGSVTAVQESLTNATLTEDDIYVGGLVGRNIGDVIASFARGIVTGEQKSTTASRSTEAGGLAGRHETGSIKASYANVEVEAKTTATAATATLTAGGLVGHLASGSIIASYSTGAPTTTGGATPTERKGGLAGFKATSGVTDTDNYWDTMTSSITSTGAGTGKTTSDLQTPTAYGTGNNDIFKDWDIDLDSVATGTQDAWEFGGNNQYPVLKYGQLSSVTQRLTVTPSVSPSTIWERAVTNPARVNVSTFTATLNMAWHTDVVVTPSANTAYRLGAPTVTVTAGNTTATMTITAVNNRVDAANNAIGVGATPDDPWAIPGTNATLTINDDDSLAMPTLTVTEGTQHNTFILTWPPVTSATGYTVQHKLNSDTTWPTAVAIQTTACTGTPVKCTYTITGVTHGNLYNIRLAATAGAAIDDSPWANVTASPGQDYDTDDDGLVEIANLAQLNAIRWNLDGDSVADSGNTANYNLAFPGAHHLMGCAENRPLFGRTCTGYELAANLDFDTNKNGVADSGDTYWNGGQGWLPIGGETGVRSYDGEFDGTNFTISNLFINRTGATYGGLFAKLGQGATVKNVALEDVDIRIRPTTSASVYVGALAGLNEREIEGSYSTGSVVFNGTFNGTSQSLNVGGLIGEADHNITASYSWATVTVTVTGADSGTVSAGGLAGNVAAGDYLTASYAAGDVTVSAGGNGVTVNAGGLAGNLDGTGNQCGGVLRARRGERDGSRRQHGGRSRSTPAGLVGWVETGATVGTSFSTGAATATDPNSLSAVLQTGGLVGINHGTVTNSYWNTETSGITRAGAGTGKTTSQLQGPTSYTQHDQQQQHRNLHRLERRPGRHDGQRRSVGLRLNEPVPCPEVRRAGCRQAASHRRCDRQSDGHLRGRPDADRRDTHGNAGPNPGMFR